MIDTLKLIRSVMSMDLKPNEKLALIACIYKVSWQTWRADFPISISSLCDESGLSRATLKRALKSLEGKQLIEREGTIYRGATGASTLFVNANKIIKQNQGAQIEPPPDQIEPPPAQIEPPPAQNEPHIYPIYSTPIYSNEGGSIQPPKRKDKSISLEEHIKRAQREHERWIKQKRSITL